MDTPEPTSATTPTTPSPAPSVTPVPRSRAFLGILLLLLVCALGELGYVLSHTSETVYSPQSVAKPFYLVLDADSGTVTSVNDQILITGSTFPGSTIALYSDLDNTIVESDSRGKFEGSVMVGENGGTLGITAYGPSGEEITKSVAYTTDTLEVLGKSTSAPGQVKKETGNTIPVKKSTTSVAPVAVTPTISAAKKATEVKLVKDFISNRAPPVKKEVLSVGKLKDVIALESTGSSKQIPGLKIHKLDVAVATGAANLSRSAVSGVITAISGSTLTVSHIIHRDRTWTVFMNSQTEITGKGMATGSAQLAIGMRIAAVGQSTGEGLLAQRIHIIPGKAIGVFTRFPIATASGQASPSATPTTTASPSPTPTEPIIPTETTTPSATPTPEI